MTPWIVAGAFVACTVIAGIGWWLTRRRLAVARAEAEQLRTMVKKRVERPNVFSHEVRTPLALIRGAAELLAEQTPGPLNARQQEFVQTITVNAQQAIGLAEDFLTEAKIEAQLFELRLEPVDLKPLLREVVKDARRLYLADIRFAEEPGPMVVLGDRALLSQAARNLVTNACRHGAAEGAVRVSAVSSEGQAIVSVSDQGEGIPAEARATLFEPFTGASHGTGLGLMITERIIAQHGGRLLVDTVEGQGATMFFTIPLARAGG